MTEYYHVVRYVKKWDVPYVIFRVHADSDIQRYTENGWKATIIDTFTEWEFARDLALKLNKAAEHFQS